MAAGLEQTDQAVVPVHEFHLLTGLSGQEMFLVVLDADEPHGDGTEHDAQGGKQQEEGNVDVQ